jgi:hypothetical protein
VRSSILQSFHQRNGREATNDQKLRNIGRPAGQSSSFKSRYSITSYNSRSSASGNHRSGFNGSNRGGYFSVGNNSNGGYRSNKQKSSQRYVTILSAPKQAACSPPVGGRLRFFCWFLANDLEGSVDHSEC